MPRGESEGCEFGMARNGTLVMFSPVGSLLILQHPLIGAGSG
jgi:hypothetical protein